MGNVYFNELTGNLIMIIIIIAVILLNAENSSDKFKWFGLSEEK